MKHKELLQHLVSVYQKAVNDTFGFSLVDYQDYLLDNWLGGGICHYLDKKLNITTHPELPYWIKRNLPRNEVYICLRSYNGPQFLQYRLTILKKELKQIQTYGYFARFIKPK